MTVDSAGAKKNGWTRTSLADRVMKVFDFDLDQLWDHLQLTGDLPSTLPEDWDPVCGAQGALSHIKDHSSMPLTPNGRRVRKPCKICGVSRVVLGCLWALEGPNLPHALVFGRELSNSISEIAEIRSRLNAAGRSYASTHKEAFQRFVEGQRLALSKSFQNQSFCSDRHRKEQEKILEENLARLAKLQADPEVVGVRPLKKLAEVDKCLKEVVREIRIVIDDVLVDLRGVIDVNAWTPQRGSKTKMVILVQRTLREEGFSWKEIADLVEEDDSRKALDRVRARVEGRGGKSRRRSR